MSVYRGSIFMFVAGGLGAGLSGYLMVFVLSCTTAPRSIQYPQAEFDVLEFSRPLEWEPVIHKDWQLIEVRYCAESDWNRENFLDGLVYELRRSHPNYREFRNVRIQSEPAQTYGRVCFVLQGYAVKEP